MSTGQGEAVEGETAGQGARDSELAEALERLRSQAAELEATTRELRETAAALAQSEARLSFAFKVAEMGPWDLDLATGGSWRSFRHDEVFGYDEPLAEWTYADFLRHVHPDDRGWVDARFGAALETATAWDFVCRIHRANDGAQRWIAARGEPVLGADGRPERVIGIVRDVTAEREAQDAIRIARAAAEAANRAKSEFLAVMSHELRTPLNAIGGYVELMEMGLRGPLTEAQRKDLERIRSSQRHLLGLINDVLNYARLEAGSVRYDLEDVPVRMAFAEAEHLVAPQIHGRGLRLATTGCTDPVAVRADAEKLRQILVNLLTNAAKFTDPGGEIELGCAQGSGTVELWVRDTGIGIPADRLESIFEPFVQVRADLTRTAEGTGLGLAISRDLARGMGGDLRVKSEPGAGSTFTLTLRAP